MKKPIRAKRKYLITAVIAVLLVGAVAIALFLPQNKSTDSNTKATIGGSSQPATDTSSTTANTTSAGAYIDYNDGVIANTKGTKILFFHAPWCPNCRALEASIKAGNIPDGVTIIKTDYDSNQALRKKYGVTLQTTLVVVDDNGAALKKYVAYDTPTLDALIKNLL